MRCLECGGTTPNPLFGSNIKVGAPVADLPAGAVKLGGSCLAMTAGCKTCYAQLGITRMVSAERMRRRNMAIVQRDPREYARIAISEIETFEKAKKKWPRLIRIHGYGDFFNTGHVRAWIEIARAFPQVRFFGTTRVGWQVAMSRTGRWQGISDVAAFRAAIDELRSMPNVFLGGSVDQETRNKPVAADLGGGTTVDYLRRNGWGIWNMFGEFADEAVRKEYGAKVMSKQVDPVAVATQTAAARKIGGMLVGVVCPEQSGKQEDCVSCGLCARKNVQVSFAYHKGTHRKSVWIDKQDQQAAAVAEKNLSANVNPGKDGMTILTDDPTTRVATRRNPDGVALCPRCSAATRSHKRVGNVLVFKCAPCGIEFSQKLEGAPRAGDPSFGHIYSDPSCVCARCEKRRAEGLEVGGHKAACRCVRCAARRKTWGTNPRRNPGGNARELYQGQEKDGHAPGVPTSYKVEVIADNSGQWATNAMRYATWHEARDAGSSLFGRWTAVQRWRVTGTDDPVYPETKSNPGRCSWCGISGQPLVQTGGNVMLCKPCDRLATKAQNRDVSANARLAATMTLQGRAGLHGRSSTTGKRQKPNPPRYSEGDVVRLEQTDFYSGLQAGSLGVVIAIPPGTPGSPYTDPMKKLLAVYWYGGRSEGVPKGLVRRLGKVRPSRRAALPRFATYSQERAVLVKSIRDGFNEWVVRGLQRTESRR
jgi:protein gp37